MSKTIILILLVVIVASCEESVGPGDGSGDPHISVKSFQITIKHGIDDYDPTTWWAIVDYEFELIGSAGYLHTMRLNFESPLTLSIVCHYPLIGKQGEEANYCPIPMNRLQERHQYIRMPADLEFAQYDNLMVDVVLEGDFNWCSHCERELWHQTLGEFVWSEHVAATVEH